MSSHDRLHQTNLFRRLSESESEALEHIVSYRSLDRGEFLFHQGDAANGFYILLEGTIRLFRSSPDGREMTLHLVGPGQMFAEAVLFDMTAFPATARATESCTVAFLPKDTFTRLIMDYPSIALRLMAALSAWLREFAEKIEALTLQDVPSRLAAYLLKLPQEPSGHVRLPVSKSALAGELGTVSETLSRAFRRLKSIGAIVEIDGVIDLIDTDHLARLAVGEKSSDD